MIIRGYFREGAPFFVVRVLFTYFEGDICFLADTGASRTLLSAYDALILGVETKLLEPASGAIVGIGGSVDSFRAYNVRFTLDADGTDVPVRGDLYVVQHDLQTLPRSEVKRILRIPSIMGREILNRFRFTCDYQSGVVQLEHK